TLQAATGMNILSAYSNEINISPTLRKGKEYKDYFDDVSDEQISQIKDALPTIDLLLDNDSMVDSYVEVVNIEIDGVTYEYKEVVTFLNNDLSTSSSYMFYYNDLSSEDEKKNISGLAFVSEEEYYPFFSKEECEVDDDEQEKTRKFVIKKGESSYIKIKEEYSQDEDEIEQELHYEVVEEGKKILDYFIKIEQEDNKDEIQIKLDNKRFKVKRELQDGDLIYSISLKGYESKQKIIFKKEILEDGTIEYNVVS
ncbi:MAG: hypothetical protein ACI4U5_04495, partial [Bacilli bacterium]